MLINYFDKYNIDTKEIEEKLSIISKSNTENASYISNMLLKALNYLFSDIDLNTDNLHQGFPNNIDEVDAIIYFDTILEDEVPLKINLNKTRLLIVGNHDFKIGKENLIYINIKEISKIKKYIKHLNKIYIGVNADNIDFSKYYYNRMRSYFLNILNKIKEIEIDELKKDIEGVCAKILLENENFISHIEINENNITFKEMIKVYFKIIKQIKNNKVEEKYMFYNTNIPLCEVEKAMLNELSMITKILNIEGKTEKFSLIYDVVCEKMLKEAAILNYCNFIDNKCITMRYTKGFPNSKMNGCCANTYKDRNKNCRFLKDDYTCSICSISCRIFTCKYLQDRGIDHSLSQYPSIDLTMGKVKKTEIIFNFFTPKEKMIKKLKAWF